MKTLIILPFWIIVHVFSYHGGSHDSNEKHDAIGIHTEYNERAYGLARFKNSFGNETTAAYTSEITKPGTIRLNYLAGVTRGCGQNEILPMILPMLSWRYKRLAGEFGCIPNSDDDFNCAAMFRIQL